MVSVTPPLAELNLLTVEHVHLISSHHITRRKRKHLKGLCIREIVTKIIILLIHIILHYSTTVSDTTKILRRVLAFREFRSGFARQAYAGKKYKSFPTAGTADGGVARKSSSPSSRSPFPCVNMEPPYNRN